MITITSNAKTKILQLMDETEENITGIRITTKPINMQQAEFGLALVAEDEIAPTDTTVNFEEFDVYVDPQSLPYVENIKIDYLETSMGSGFKIDKSGMNSSTLPEHLADNPMAERIQQIIDSHINPAIAMHGGWVALIDLKDNDLYLEMGGGCQGCGMAAATLRQGIETLLRQNVPDLGEIYDVTEHDLGLNPYYR
ncbi:MAG: iron-sulfur cluster assembly accessory protein [Gemmatimonadetes bacterium]|nr:MAG: iron-sulfur cluster assembly accessory protein [Gemmatimonadota bacterium]